MRAASSRSRSVVIAVVLTLVLVAVAAVVVLQRQRAADRARDDGARAAADALAAAWSAGDPASAPQATGAAAVREEYDAVVAGLGGSGPAPAPTVEVTGVQRTETAARADLAVTWPLGTGWSYATTAPLEARDPDDPESGWAVAFSPAVVHPRLAAGDRLSASRTPSSRGAVLGRDGAALVADAPVVEVGVQPSRATDVPALTARLAELVDVDAAGLAERITAAAPDAFVPVITLRRSDYDPVRDQLQPLPGTVFRESTRPLAPTRDFARALLGTVGPASEEVVEASEGRVLAGDTTGLSGLQRRYDAQLAGTPGTSVTLVRAPAAGAAEDAEAVTEELFAVPPVDGTDLQLSLDARVQQAADAALAGAVAAGAAGNGNASLVAVDVPTGDVLAVANTPASGANRALTGQYPPGSTFKAVSTLALLGTGLTPQEVVGCPATATVDGRSFRNFEGGAAGDVPFAVDFAQSCNTAFVQLSSRLDAAALAAAGADVGLGGAWSLGTDAFTGSVPAEGSAVDVAAATIGQGEVLASPVAMAAVASTIARGSWADPRLVLTPAPEAGEGASPAPDPARLGVVRDLMREVAVSGTASALADVPGAPVHAKTGTAEFGTATPPQTHAWTIGFQGDVAFAVVVEEGASGGRVAVPVAESFLRALGG